MKTAHSPLADPMKILTRKELSAVLADLHRKAPRSKNTRLNRVVFRLAACSGMRVSEIAQLQLADVVVDLARPHIRVRAAAAKGNRPRVVPLWWDEGTQRDLVAWKEERASPGAEHGDPFVGCQDLARLGSPLSRSTLRKRFRAACKVLGAKRLDRLTIRHGRHSFISHALAGGRTLAEVRDAAGHANVSITSGYLHVAVEDEGVGRLFG
jgi:integrase